MPGNSQQTQQQSSTSPWAPQQGYLLGAFGDAQNLYNQDTASGPYTGNYVATANPEQTQSYTDAYNFGTGGYNTANTVLGGVGSDLSNGASNTQSAASALGNYGSTNQTGNLTNTASQIASGFNVPGEVANSMLAANQEAADSTLPSLYRGAAASGNLNSDRTAISDGVVRQGLAEQAANLGASLQNSAYSTGLSTAQNQNSQQLSALANAGSLGNAQTSAGLNAAGTGLNAGASSASTAEGGANGLNALTQLGLTNALDQFNGTNNYGWTQLSNLMNIIGGKSWGSNTTQTGTTQSNPSGLSTAGSVLGLLGSII